MAWDRVVNLKVGRFKLGNEEAEGYLDLSALDLEFEVIRSIRFWENSAQITIYNASAETINFLMGEGVAVILEAGHVDEKVGVIYSGQIGMVRTEREGPNVKTTISCISARGAYYQLAKLSCDVVFSKTATVREVLDRLCAWAGIALRAGKDAALNTPLGRPFTFSGSFTECLKSFGGRMVQLIGKNVYFDNNELIVMGKGANGDWNRVDLERIDLNYNNGLICATEIRDESANEIQGGGDPYYMLVGTERGDAIIKKYNIKEPEKAAKNVDRLRRVNFGAIISPIFAPNVFVNLDSSKGDSYDSVMAVKGRFLILETNFRGDNMGGSFRVDCEALQAK